ncbi:PREDICTED: small cell adhesion glycoprotein isoform X1 [Propithecus coquereli]|nr:PREDICTED: small cell adhesion glycoprotein isoform X1 [Propithecus coquereli]
MNVNEQGRCGWRLVSHPTSPPLVDVPKLADLPSFGTQTYLSRGPSVGLSGSASPGLREISAVRARVEFKRTRGVAPALPRQPVQLERSALPRGLQPLAAMTSFLTTPSPGEELMTTPILQATEALSPEAGASTALIAVVITVVFLTLLSVVILIFFYLYKNKGSYVTYESAEGEPSAILQMENDSAKGREKEEYFI